MNHLGGGGDDDNEEDAAETTSDRDEEGFLLEVIGTEAEDEDEYEGAGIEGDSVVLTDEPSPAEGSNEGRDKVLDGLSTSAEPIRQLLLYPSKVLTYM